MRWIFKNTAVQIALGISLALFIVGTLMRIDNSSNKKLGSSLSPSFTSKASVLGDIVRNPFAAINSTREFNNLQNLINKSSGVYSLYIKSFDGSNEYRINSERKYFIASLYKLPVAAAVLAEIDSKNITYDTEFIFTEDDFEEGAGNVQGYETGTPFTVDFLLSTLLKSSDNSAQLILENNVAYKRIGEILPAEFEGIKNKEASPEEIAAYFEFIYKTDLLTAESKKRIFNDMAETDYDDRINLGLTEQLTFSHKIGNWPETGTWHDCGIIVKEKTTVVCLMSEGASFEEFQAVGEQTGRLLSSLEL